MKIAFIVLPNTEDPCITPPLPIGYLGALLEQQRHIVRIYDLALHDTSNATEALAPLRAFRPHMAIVAASSPSARNLIEAALAGITANVMHIELHMRSATPAQAVARALWSLERPSEPTDEQSVIFEALLGLDDDLDTLPFPARHLLPLEQYPLFTPMGDLQTTLLTGQQFTSTSYIPRNPALISAELRSVAREHGIRHFILAGPLLTLDTAWLHDLLYHLATSDAGVCWEGSASFRQLTPDLLRMFRRAGCEVLSLPFDAAEVLDSKDARTALLDVVRIAHELGMAVRGQIDLDPSYSAMPTLVDLAATFGLDDVRFSMPSTSSASAQPATGSAELENITEMVQSRYRSSQSRQFFVERFGARMGPILWRVGRSGLLGRAWQRRAGGNDEIAHSLTRGASA
ncbi:hypothetical protein SE17_03350 [Kouleothrix aurantiaca]|uniref:B12-binding domain-containing protein n=1 Tax=Kouleothrix aurantiaca TaxID=186479 RepID=A0A0P9DLY2_9CHLR|nr:hypothetical protein SE17_03350 [Kouleothrix aurantiaca]